MAANRVGLGLVGCGWIAEAAHMPALAGMPNCEVLGACDLRDDRRAVASRFFPGARLYASIDGLLSDPAITAVVVALPPVQNRSAAVAILASGRDLYIEKPLSGNLTDGRAILAAVPTGAVAMIGFNFRFNPVIVAAREAVERGEIGEILSIQSQMSFVKDSSGTWRADPTSGGGALSDLASHHIDLAQIFCGGPVKSVTADIRSHKTLGDCAELQMRMQSGAIVQISVSMQVDRTTNRLVLNGTKGQLELDLLVPSPLRIHRGTPAYGRAARLLEMVMRLHPVAAVTSMPGEPSFAASLGKFIRACQVRETEVTPGLDAGIAVLEIIDMARRSADASGARISQHENLVVV